MELVEMGIDGQRYDEEIIEMGDEEKGFEDDKKLQATLQVSFKRR